VTDKQGAIRDNPRENPDQAVWRAASARAPVGSGLETARHLFATMFGLLFLACMPILQRFYPGLGAGSPFGFLVPIVDAALIICPNFLKPWFDAFREAPERLFAGALFVGLLSWCGSSLQWAYSRSDAGDLEDAAGRVTEDPDSWIYKLRNAGRVQGSYYVLTHWILPTTFAALIAVVLITLAYCAVAVLGRVSFAAYDVSVMFAAPVLPQRQ